MRRYEVIKAYPESPYGIGQWITVFPEESRYDFYKKFPEFFREFGWWEDISFERMPKYVKKISDKGYWRKGDILEVSHWFIPENISNKCHCKAKVGYDHCYLASEVEPSTKEEYEKFKKQLKNPNA